MNQTQLGVITLLKSALTGQALPLPGEFDLGEALPGLKSHHMSTLLYEGAQLCGIDRGTPVMQSLFRSYCMAMLVSEGQMQALERIYAVFDSRGIDYMPLKGSRMKAMYPRPELRLMGDADLLIRTEQYDRIVPVMEELGFVSKHGSDHELVWISGELYLELHKRLMPTYESDFYGYFGEGWDFAVPTRGGCHEMTVEDEFVYLFVHFAKHFREGGVGCRYVADLWVYRSAHPDMDEEKVQAAMERLGLRDFYGNIRRVMAAWFEDGPADDLTDTITDFIFDSGSWGSNDSRALGRTVLYSRDTPNTGSRWAYLRGLLFPSVEMLKEKYTILQKHPRLLPLVWLVRPVYKLLFERDSVKQQGRALAAVTDDAVALRRRFLEQVGL